jgi:mono/diheme cytochrome c family protein
MKKECVRCHGEQLDDTGPEAHTLLIRPTNFRTVTSRSKTDWELLITIANGALFTPMHAYRGKLTDQQMIDVLSYIRTIAPTDTLG